MTSYLTSMDTISLSLTVFEIFDFKNFRVWPWPLTPKGHLGSKNFILFESPYMTSYLTSMDTISLSLTVFEIFDFKNFRVWPWPLTPKGHLGSKKNYYVRKPIYDFLFDFYGHHLYLSPFSRYSTSKILGCDLDLWPLKVIWGRKFLYRSKAHIWLPIWLLWTPSLYLSPFSRYSTSKILGCDLDRWPLKVILGQKIITFESPYMTSYLTSMDTISLSLTVFEIFDFKIFRVWPWPLTPKGHLRSKHFIPLESPYMTSYLTSMDTISLSLTVFEIFDFKNFRVWPWPFTPKSHLGSKIFIQFESPYMTSYLTSMDTISLSLTVFEIFDFKNFRVWPWPLTPKGHLGSKNFIPFESPYMTSYLTSMDTISLSLTVLEIMLVEILKAEQNGGFWPFKGQGQGSIFFYHQKGSSSHQTASFEILRIKIGSAV